MANNPQYEMFGSADVPFYGDYNWVQPVERPDGSLFAYMTWTENRDVVVGTDPREATQDGFRRRERLGAAAGRHVHAPVQRGRLRPEYLRNTIT